MQSNHGFKRAVSALNEFAGYICAWLTTGLMLVVCFDVTTRYVFNYSLVWVQELQWHLFAIIFLLGAGWTLAHDRHVRVDVFFSNMSPRWKAIINLLGTWVFLIPFCIIGFWFSQKYTMASFGMGEGSPNPGGLPARYLLKAAIPTSFALLFLQGLVMTQDNIQFLRGKGPDPSEQSGGHGAPEAGV